MLSKSKIIIFLNALLPAFLWAGLIFFFSSLQTLPSPEVFVFDFILKKSAHMFMYAVLYFLVYRAFQLLADKKINSDIWFFALIVCLIYAISDEMHQAFIANRTATARDVGYDLLGSSIVLSKKLGYI